MEICVVHFEFYKVFHMYNKLSSNIVSQAILLVGDWHSAVTVYGNIAAFWRGMKDDASHT